MLYNALVALPSKTIGISTGSIGVLAAFWPTWLETKVGAKVTADTIQTAGMALMAASIVYFAMLWLLKPSVSDVVESPSQSNASGGSGSANFAGNHGHITVNQFSSAVPVEPKPRVPKPAYTQKGLDGLERALLGYQPAPNFPLNGVIVKVYKSLGGMPKERHMKEKFIQKVDLAIADAIVERGLTVWGRLADRPREQISPTLLRKARFKHIWKFIEVPVEAVRPVRYTDLMFNKEEIEEVWP